MNFITILDIEFNYLMIALILTMQIPLIHSLRLKLLLNQLGHNIGFFKIDFDIDI